MREQNDPSRKAAMGHVQLLNDLEIASIFVTLSHIYSHKLTLVRE